MSTKLPPIALFGYDSSPFTHKIRLTLRMLQIPYTFVLVPSMMPRPILVDSFNLTYRKIPVLAIGRRLIVDTSLIVEWLHAHPELKAWRDEQAKVDEKYAGQEVHSEARSRVLGRLLSSHYTDRPLFRLTTGLIPSVVWRTSFGEDRAELIGHKLNPDKLEKKVPRNLASLDTYLSILEPLFSDGQCGWILGGTKPSLVDISLYYQLSWGRSISKGEGIQDLTGGGTGDGTGEGMDEVFNEQRYPGLWSWFERFAAYVDSLPNVETRVERRDGAGVDEIMRCLRQSDRSDKVALLPTANALLTDLEERNGLQLGTRVSVAPDDTGRDNPTVGRLVGLSPEEVVIEPDAPQMVGKEVGQEKVDGITLHFPRVGFVVSPVRQAKL